MPPGLEPELARSGGGGGGAEAQTVLASPAALGAVPQTAAASSTPEGTWCGLEWPGEAGWWGRMGW